MKVRRNATEFRFIASYIELKSKTLNELKEKANQYYLIWLQSKRYFKTRTARVSSNEVKQKVIFSLSQDMLQYTLSC